MDKQDELRLVEQAQAGDAESYGRLAERYAGVLTAIAYSRVGNFAVSEDIAQDALLLGYEKLRALRQPARFGAWLRTIARNLCKRWHRNASYRDRLNGAAESLSQRLGYDRPTDVSEAAERAEARGLLHAAIDRLPAKEREALLLYYFEGKSASEAASLAGLSPAAMRKRLQRARDSLREYMTTQVEHELVGMTRERRMEKRVLAALSSGATYSKLAEAGTVVPSATAMALSSSVGKSALVAAGLVVACIVLPLATNTRPWVVSASKSGQQETSRPVDVEAEVHPNPAESQDVRAQVTAETPVETDPRVLHVKSDETGDAELVGTDESLPAVSGTVRTSGREPVPGAHVQLVRKTEQYGQIGTPPLVAAEVQTDENGSFRIGPLPQGEPMLALVAHPDWSIGGVSVEALKSDEHRRNVDVVLYPPATLRGSVVDKHGRGLPGASVFILHVLAQDELDMEHQDDARRASIAAGYYGGALHVTAGDGGRFEFDSIPEGCYVSQLGARKAGYVPNYAFNAESAAKRRAEFAEKGRSAWFAATIPLPSQDITIVLEEAGSITGRVVIAENRRPVSGALVMSDGMATDPALDARVHYSLVARTDEDGRYRFDEMGASTANIQAAKDGLVSRIVALALGTNREQRQVNLSLHAPGAIEGTVYDAETNRPISGARIGYWCEGTPRIQTSDPSDSQGRYCIPGLAEGNWTVWPLPDWQLSKKHHSGSSETKIRVEFGRVTGDTDLYCEKRGGRSGTITGHVLSSRRRPVADATVRVRGTQRSVKANTEGAYALDSMTAGTYELVAFDPQGENSGTVRVEVGENTTTEADIHLVGGVAYVEGILIDDQGEPVTQPIRVQLIDRSDWRHLAPVFVGNDGRYTSLPLVPGRYRVQLCPDDQGLRITPPHYDIDLKEDERADGLDFVVSPMAGFLSGTVVFADGSPAASFPVEAGDGQVTVRSVTDDAGAFLLEPIDGADLYLRVRGPGHGSEVWTVVPGLQSGTSGLRVVLDAPGKVIGRVLAPADSKGRRECDPGRRLRPDGHKHRLSRSRLLRVKSATRRVPR